MQTAIYIPGLGEATTRESIVKYASRFMKELDTDDEIRKNRYFLKVEKIVINSEEPDGCSTVSIYKKTDTSEEMVYRFYEFGYSDMLTRKFKSRTVIVRSLLLFGIVLVKLPVVLQSLFWGGKSFYYAPRFRMQLIYSFILLVILALSGTLLLPALLDVILETTVKSTALQEVFADFPKLKIMFINIHDFLNVVSKPLITFSILFFAFAPDSRSAITSFATEVVCADNYLRLGDRKQHIHGNLDLLIEYIAETNAKGVTIDIHAYSFGSIIALDYLFPFGNSLTKSACQTLKGLVTIGCPFDFVKMYYNTYFDQRKEALAGNIKWLNVYSPSDALATNFRTDMQNGEPNYSVVDPNKLKPINLPPYSISNFNPYNPVHFFSLRALRAHSNYWDESVHANSCLRDVVKHMKNERLYEERMIEKVLQQEA